MALAALIALALAGLLAGCGKSEEVVDPLLGKVGEARQAQALSSLQQALTAAALVRSESGGSFGSGAEDLAHRLQAKDPSKRFSTTPPSGPGDVQVLGGGGAAFLVASGGTGSYVAIWDDGGGAPMYYRGSNPPAFSAQRPAGDGWNAQP